METYSIEVTGLTQEELDRIDKYARAHGMSVSGYISELIRKSLDTNESESPQDRAMRFREWAESHRWNKVVLPDEAMSRAGIYEE